MVMEGQFFRKAIYVVELDSGEFGSVCMCVPCELSKKSKCMETIPHVEIFLYVIYCMVEMDSNCYD